MQGVVSMTAFTQPQVLETSAGQFLLQEYRLRLAGREWSVLHTGAVLSREDELRFLAESPTRPPYGVALWPSAIALAHEVVARGNAFRGLRVIELGAGTGLPGIVAATFGARVVQTDRQEAAIHVCRGNGRRNGIETIDYRLAEWTSWRDYNLYDYIIGSDILYAEKMHPHLAQIFESNLAAGGRILLADPFREPGVRFLQSLEGEGWRFTLTKWSVGEEGSPRPIGIFQLSRPD
jgi:predicted nicotinamide N-methyase